MLCRTNDYVRMVGQALRDAGIPTAAASLGSVLHLPEVVEVLSLLRVLETADNGALVRLLTGPQWRIGPSDRSSVGTDTRSARSARLRRDTPRAGCHARPSRCSELRT